MKREEKVRFSDLTPITLRNSPQVLTSNYIYLSKFIKNTLIHSILLLLFFITISPIFLYLDLNIFDLSILFTTTLIVIETNYLINYTIKLLKINAIFSLYPTKTIVNIIISRNKI